MRAVERAGAGAGAGACACLACALSAPPAGGCAGPRQCRQRARGWSGPAADGSDPYRQAPVQGAALVLQPAAAAARGCGGAFCGVGMRQEAPLHRQPGATTAGNPAVVEPGSGGRYTDPPSSLRLGWAQISRYTGRYTDAVRGLRRPSLKQSLPPPSPPHVARGLQRPSRRPHRSSVARARRPRRRRAAAAP